ncbi:MAG TPA: PspC domain-containing protein [Acidimicrobiales bacterium]
MSNDNTFDRPPALEPGTSFDATVSTASPEPPHLRRSRQRRLLGGVAGGISERFDVNAYLVRAIFLVLAFLWGLGVAIYLVMWVVVPSVPNDGEDSRERTRASVSTSHRLTVAVLAAVVALAILTLAVVRPVNVLGPSIGVVWIVFLVVLAIVAIRTPARRLTFRRIAGIVFLIGTSLVILLVSGFMAFVASTGVSLSGGNGDHFFGPTSLAQVRHVYRTEFGVSTVNLSGVEFPTTGFSLLASVAAGQLNIVVPADAVVSLSTNVGAGTVASGFDLQGVQTRPYVSQPSGLSPAQLRSSPHVTIDARVGAGQIDIMRAVVSKS